jgi:hypothetical protein
VIRTPAGYTKLPSLYLTSLHSTPHFQVVPQNVSALLVRQSTWSLSFHMTTSRGATVGTKPLAGNLGVFLHSITHTSPWSRLAPTGRTEPRSSGAALKDANSNASVQRVAESLRARARQLHLSLPPRSFLCLYNPRHSLHRTTRVPAWHSPCL